MIPKNLLDKLSLQRRLEYILEYLFFKSDHDVFTCFLKEHGLAIARELAVKMFDDKRTDTVCPDKLVDDIAKYLLSLMTY